MAPDDNGNGRVKQGQMEHAVAALEAMHSPDGVCGRWREGMDVRIRTLEAFRDKWAGAMVVLQVVSILIGIVAIARGGK